jgi:hypothetical protein
MIDSNEYELSNLSSSNNPIHLEYFKDLNIIIYYFYVSLSIISGIIVNFLDP